ncbi:RNI-like protein [Ramicandelaber brevisporus]|nr:RNI-like protein [Ramicandelaber brevisporus]
MTDLRVGQRVVLKTPAATTTSGGGGGGCDDGDTESYGTIRYVGPVDGTQGSWIGVEWDASLAASAQSSSQAQSKHQHRGKHSGEYKGKRYFDCKVPGTGSFIRPNARGLSAGISFISALRARYCNQTSQALATTDPDSFILNADRVVEYVRIVEEEDRSGDDDALLPKLAVASLEGEHISCLAKLGSDDYSPPFEGIAPMLQSLLLARNLIADWDTVIEICGMFPQLNVLSLTGNRLAQPSDELVDGVSDKVFGSLRILHLDRAGISWQLFMRFAHWFPQLEQLSLGTNRISSLALPPTNDRQRQALQKLRILELYDNDIGDLSELKHIQHLMPSLTHLDISSNSIAEIKPIEGLILPKLISLDIGYNNVADWSSLDILNNEVYSTSASNTSTVASMFPSLTDLFTSGNPILTIAALAKQLPHLPQHQIPDHLGRTLTVARIGQLKCLNRTNINASERKDSELYYRNLVINSGRADGHPRFAALCSKYGDPPPSFGNPDAKSQRNLSSAMTGTLGASLVAVNLELNLNGSVTKLVRKLPRTTTISTLRQLVRKLMGKQLTSLKRPIGSIVLEFYYSPGAASDDWLLDDDSRSLDYYGIVDESNILIKVK